jgi:hypothetical protein
MKIRAKSSGEVIEMNGVCDCGYKTPVTINLDEVGVGEIKKLSPISLTSNASVKVKYPSLSDILVSGGGDEVDNTLKVISKCISEIYVGEDTFVVSEQTDADVLDFVETLTDSQFKQLQDFVEDIPRLSHKLDFTCAKCGKIHSVPMEGIDAFFPDSV